MKLTGIRADKRDDLLIASRAGLVDWNVYRKRVQTLERQEKKLIEAKKDRAAARALKEEKKREEKEAKIAANRKAGIEKRKATIAAKKAAAAGGKRVFISKDTLVLNAKSVWDMFKSLNGKQVEVSATVKNIDTNVVYAFNDDFVIDSPSKSWSSMELRTRTVTNSGSESAAFVANTYVIFNVKTQVVAKRNKQSFKEGEVNCFIAPVIKYLQEKEEEYKTVASKKKIQQVIRRAESLEKEYRDSGVPEDKIEEICKTLGISVSIYDILKNKLNEYNPGKNWKLCFFNTRFNHLDMGHLSVKDTPIELTEEQMFNKVVSLVKSGTFFMTQGKSVFTKQFISWIKNTDNKIIKLKDCPIPALIRCLEASYKLVDTKQAVMMKMDEAIDKTNKSVDAVRYESLAKFLKSGYIVNSKPVFFQDQEAAIGHLDMNNAYAQFKEAGKYYSGFLGKVWKWSKLNKADKTFVENHLGYYKFKIMGLRKHKAFFEKLGLYEGKEYVMFSPEILCLVDMGLSVKILAGAWGSRFDFEFTPEMIESGLFREWSGKLGMDNKDTCFTFYDNQEMAENIKAEHSNVRVYYNDGQIKVFVPKTSQPTYFHIAGGITSYTRINILMKMKELGVDNIVKVMLDGIYTSVPVVADDLFKDEKIKEHKDAGNSWYYEYSEGVEDLCMDWPEFDGISERLTSLEGAGGTGKTHSILKSSYHKPVYVPPTRLLGRKMNKDMGCIWTTLHKLVGLDGENKKVRNWIEEGNPVPHVIFIDERTMCSKNMIEKALAMFPESMILLAGDMEGKQWFQTRFGEGNILTDIYDTTGWAVKKYETDYRAKDDQLKSLKVALRDLMRKCFTDGGRSDATVIESWLASKVNVVGFFDAVDMFNNGCDFWISPKNEDSDRLINNNVISGYRVKHSTREYSKGEALNEDVGSCCEKRGSFTVHSTQGLTISNGKLFISIYGSFEYSMLYTAISRAVHFDQLVFVGK